MPLWLIEPEDERGGGANWKKRSGTGSERRVAQARPSVSNMVETNASRLSLPAQTTNWKA
jgi:hypothetical protein